jgi:hypothetical protein
MSNEQMVLSNEKFFDGDTSNLVKLAQLNTMNINGLSQQMGLMNDRMDQLVGRMDGHDNRLEVLEHNTTINRAESKRIKKAVLSRVNYLLKIEFEGGRVADSSIATDQLYRGQFVSRCYTDAKNHSKMGDSYPETLKVDFDEVLEYIESWVPEVDGGVDGYKRYLDIRREERMRD